MLLEDNEIIRDKQQIAEIFNNYYINILETTTGRSNTQFPDISSLDSSQKIDNIVEHFKDHLSIQLIKQEIKPSISFDFPLTTEENTVSLIKSVNKNAATGLDKIPPKILNTCADIISKPLTSIINSTIINKKFVNECKIAAVIPLYKNPKEGSRLDKKCFRPISVLNAFSKIFEKHYETSMFEYTNKIFSKYISAYRKGSSCHHVLISLTEEWRKYLDKNEIVGAVLMDLSKAFDCLPHELLIAKLEAYGMGKK